MEQRDKHNAPFPEGSPLQEYFSTLPKGMQELFIQSGAPVTTVEELERCVEQLSREGLSEHA